MKQTKSQRSRHSALIARRTRGLELTCDKRTLLRGIAMTRHCNLELSKLRSMGLLRPRARMERELAAC